jgi:hypothetical protein
MPPIQSISGLLGWVFFGQAEPLTRRPLRLFPPSMQQTLPPRRKQIDMKKLLAVIVTTCALVGCDRHNALIEDEKDNTKNALNDRKEAVDDATKTAKKQTDADAKSEKARLEANQEKAHAQIEADKKKVDAEAKAEKAENNAQKKVE